MEKIAWTTQKRVVNDLLPLEINPRKITEEKKQLLIKSIEKFNLAEIPAINFDNTIIAGHQRIKALQIIGRGEELIDVRIPNRQLTKTEIKEYNLISNTHSGDWDFDILDLHFADIDVDFTGVNLSHLKQIQEISNSLDTENGDKVLPPAEEDDYEIPTEITTDIVLGDLIEIGPHKLICADSTQTDTFKRLLGQELADLVLTDPPYNVAYEGKTKQKLTIQNDKQDSSSFYAFLYDFYTALNAFVKQGGGVVRLACR